MLGNPFVTPAPARHKSSNLTMTAPHRILRPSKVELGQQVVLNGGLQLSSSEAADPIPNYNLPSPMTTTYQSSALSPKIQAFNHPPSSISTPDKESSFALPSPTVAPDYSDSQENNSTVRQNSGASPRHSTHNPFMTPNHAQRTVPRVAPHTSTHPRPYTSAQTSLPLQTPIQHQRLPSALPAHVAPAAPPVSRVAAPHTVAPSYPRARSRMPPPPHPHPHPRSHPLLQPHPPVAAGVPRAGSAWQAAPAPQHTHTLQHTQLPHQHAQRHLTQPNLQMPTAQTPTMHAPPSPRLPHTHTQQHTQHVRHTQPHAPHAPLRPPHATPHAYPPSHHPHQYPHPHASQPHVSQPQPLRQLPQQRPPGTPVHTQPPHSRNSYPHPHVQYQPHSHLPHHPRQRVQPPQPHPYPHAPPQPPPYPHARAHTPTPTSTSAPIAAPCSLAPASLTASAAFECDLNAIHGHPHTAAPSAAPAAATTPSSGTDNTATNTTAVGAHGVPDTEGTSAVRPNAAPAESSIAGMGNARADAWNGASKRGDGGAKERMPPAQVSAVRVLDTSAYVTDASDDSNADSDVSEDGGDGAVVGMGGVSSSTFRNSLRRALQQASAAATAASDYASVAAQSRARDNATSAAHGWRASAPPHSTTADISSTLRAGEAQVSPAAAARTPEAALAAQSGLAASMPAATQAQAPAPPRAQTPAAVSTVHTRAHAPAHAPTHTTPPTNFPLPTDSTTLSPPFPSPLSSIHTQSLAQHNARVPPSFPAPLSPLAQLNLWTSARAHRAGVPVSDAYLHLIMPGAATLPTHTHAGPYPLGKTRTGKFDDSLLPDSDDSSWFSDGSGSDVSREFAAATTESRMSVRAHRHILPHDLTLPYDRAAVREWEEEVRRREKKQRRGTKAGRPNGKAVIGHRTKKPKRTHNRPSDRSVRGSIAAHSDSDTGTGTDTGTGFGTEDDASVNVSVEDTDWSVSHNDADTASTTDSSDSGYPRHTRAHGQGGGHLRSRGDAKHDARTHKRTRAPTRHADSRSHMRSRTNPHSRPHVSSHAEHSPASRSSSSRVSQTSPRSPRALAAFLLAHGPALTSADIADAVYRCTASSGGSARARAVRGLIEAVRSGLSTSNGAEEGSAGDVRRRIEAAVMSAAERAREAHAANAYQHARAQSRARVANAKAAAAVGSRRGHPEAPYDHGDLSDMEEAVEAEVDKRLRVREARRARLSKQTLRRREREETAAEAEDASRREREEKRSRTTMTRPCETHRGNTRGTRASAEDAPADDASDAARASSRTARTAVHGGDRGADGVNGDEISVHDGWAEVQTEEEVEDEDVQLSKREDRQSSTWLAASDESDRDEDDEESEAREQRHQAPSRSHRVTAPASETPTQTPPPTHRQPRGPARIHKRSHIHTSTAADEDADARAHMSLDQVRNADSTNAAAEADLPLAPPPPHTRHADTPAALSPASSQCPPSPSHPQHVPHAQTRQHPHDSHNHTQRLSPHSSSPPAARYDHAYSPFTSRGPSHRPDTGANKQFIAENPQFGSAPVHTQPHPPTTRLPSPPTHARSLADSAVPRPVHADHPSSPRGPGIRSLSPRMAHTLTAALAVVHGVDVARQVMPTVSQHDAAGQVGAAGVHASDPTPIQAPKDISAPQLSPRGRATRLAQLLPLPPLPPLPSVSQPLAPQPVSPPPALSHTHTHAEVVAHTLESSIPTHAFSEAGAADSVANRVSAASTAAPSSTSAWAAAHAPRSRPSSPLLAPCIPPLPPVPPLVVVAPPPPPPLPVLPLPPLLSATHALAVARGLPTDTCPPFLSPSLTEAPTLPTHPRPPLPRPSIPPPRAPFVLALPAMPTLRSAQRSTHLPSLPPPPVPDTTDISMSAPHLPSPSHALAAAAPQASSPAVPWLSVPLASPTPTASPRPLVASSATNTHLQTPATTAAPAPTLPPQTSTAASAAAKAPARIYPATPAHTHTHTHPSTLPTTSTHAHAATSTDAGADVGTTATTTSARAIPLTIAIIRAHSRVPRHTYAHAHTPGAALHANASLTLDAEARQSATLPPSIATHQALGATARPSGAVSITASLSSSPLPSSLPPSTPLPSSSAPPSPPSPSLSPPSLLPADQAASATAPTDVHERHIASTTHTTRAMDTAQVMPSTLSRVRACLSAARGLASRAVAACDPTAAGEGPTAGLLTLTHGGESNGASAHGEAARVVKMGNADRRAVSVAVDTAPLSTITTAPTAPASAWVPATMEATGPIPYQHTHQQQPHHPVSVRVSEPALENSTTLALASPPILTPTPTPVSVSVSDSASTAPTSSPASAAASTHTMIAPVPGKSALQVLRERRLARISAANATSVNKQMGLATANVADTTHAAHLAEHEVFAVMAPAAHDAKVSTTARALASSTASHSQPVPAAAAPTPARATAAGSVYAGIPLDTGATASRQAATTPTTSISASTSLASRVRSLLHAAPSAVAALQATAGGLRAPHEVNVVSADNVAASHSHTPTLASTSVSASALERLRARRRPSQSLPSEHAVPAASPRSGLLASVPVR